MTGIWPNYQKLISNNFKNLTVEKREIKFLGAVKFFDRNLVTAIFIKTPREVYRSSVTLLNSDYFD